MITAEEALARLQEGNRRFVAGEAGEEPGGGTAAAARRAELVSGQEPFAIVLGCSDSRVPVELVFDQGPGDLFVVRVAGNVAAPTQVGSVEFAADAFGTSLVVVLGHTGCGAVSAALAELQGQRAPRSPGLRAILDRVAPSLAGLAQSELHAGEAALAREAVRANVRAAVRELGSGSQLLERRIATDGLRIVGAEYALETGLVDFFDGMDGLGAGR